MNYTTNLRKMRKQRHLTIEQLSELTGIGAATISRIENGETDMYVSTLLVLCDFFKCDPLNLVKFNK